MSSYAAFPYGPFAATTSGSQSSQYFHGTAFGSYASTSGSATVGGSGEASSPSPPSSHQSSSVITSAAVAAPSTCQQSTAFDYSMYYNGQNSHHHHHHHSSYHPYQYPYLTAAAATAAAAATNGFSSVLSGNNPNSSPNSSPTYQSMHHPTTDTTNFPYHHHHVSNHHHSLENPESPTSGASKLCPVVASPSSDLLVVPTSNGSSSSLAKKGSGKSRGRGRRAPNPSPSPENALEQVFIWDLDETLIILYSLLTGSFGQRYHKDERTTHLLGKKMEDMVYILGDCQFFYNDLEDCDQVHIDDVSTDDTGQDLTNYDFENDGFRDTRQSALGIPSAVRGGVDWMRKLAFRYRRIKEIYNQYRNGVEALVPDHREEWITLRNNIEEITDGWLTLARKCLHLISQREKCANVLVTPTPLVYAISKVLLHRLGPYFPIENIYSSAKVGYENVFEKLVQKYGKSCTFVVIGDGRDEEAAAKKLHMPFWRISNRSDLENLNRALEYKIM